MERVSDNVYVESAQLSERPAEEQQPLLTPPIPPRVMADGASTAPGVVHESADQHTTNALPQHITVDGGAGDPTYAPVLTTSPNAVCAPASTEKVSYKDILKFQNKQVS